MLRHRRVRFIGANLVHELAARGHQVKALLRPESDSRAD